MDVRCDRCQTEYELDDDSVTEGGASVQCTTCGHTFVVGPDGVTIAQIVPTPPAGMSDLLGAVGGPQAADWLLATEDGQTHRFRDLTTLQKWVVERKATREDRVSQRGGPWRPLGEVGELAPFFEVVDQADWARSAETSGGARPRTPEGLSSRQTPTRQTSLSRPGGSRKRANGVGAAEDQLMARLDSQATPSIDDDDFPPEEEKFQTMAIFRTQRGLKIAGGAGFVALAIVAAFLGFSRPRWVPFFKSQDKVPAGHVEKAADPTAPTAVPAPAPVAAIPAPVPPPVPISPPRPALAAPPAPGVDPLAASKPAAAEHPVAEPGGVVKAKSYERLVAEADRLMENGAPVRAQRLLDEALAMQPNGVSALSGSAYLQLDRHKPLAAIATFKRALSLSPEFPPALFGLAEAYRAQGELSLAAENYRKYIGVAPGAPDAPAARRQLKEIDSLTPRRPAAEAAPASVPEAAKREEPAPPAAEPP